MITSAANTIVLNAVIVATFDSISHISLRKSSGEFFRKAVTDITVINASKETFTFFITESEGNDDIVEVGLHGNGATTTLNSGSTYATQTLVLTKTSSQSLAIDWTITLV